LWMLIPKKGPCRLVSNAPLSSWRRWSDSREPHARLVRSCAMQRTPSSWPTAL
jgi:hypothetical protein